MGFDFDEVIDRRGTNSVKWQHFSEDVLPLWVADMDFSVAPAIVSRIQKRLEHPIFGYSVDSPELIEQIVHRMAESYHWQINADSVTLIPGIVVGFNFAIRAVCNPGDSVIFHTPAYPPFFQAPINNQVNSIISPLVFHEESGLYELDLTNFEAKITPETKMLLLCNPQNPTGRVFTREELSALGEICVRHDLIICSDEIHNEIIYSGFHHTPIASINDELAQRTITLIAPSKTFNIPGLSCSAAIIPNPELFKKYQRALKGFCSDVTCLSQEAAIAAYKDGGEWLKQLNLYLEGNRDFLRTFISQEIPGIKTTEIQATFLSWLDCTDLPIEGSPQEYFEKQAKVGLNAGASFGTGYDKFVRLNFGTSRKILTEALEKMAASVKRI